MVVEGAEAEAVPIVAEAIRETVVGPIQADQPLQEEGHVNY